MIFIIFIYHIPGRSHFTAFVAGDTNLTLMGAFQKSSFLRLKGFVFWLRVLS